MRHQEVFRATRGMLLKRFQMNGRTLEIVVG